DFSSIGPTPLSLRMKPDVAAPGVDVTSSVPQREGAWAVFSGTSMAAPHVAGAAALLRQRHPAWTVEQIKSALVQTAAPALAGGREASTTREGGGLADLPRADDPRRAVARRFLPLPGRALGDRCRERARRAGAGLLGHAAPAGRELRRRRPLAGTRGARRAADRRRR